jgi:hypothetical protein
LKIFDPKNVTTLYHPPYSADLSLPDYFLLPKLKMKLKRLHFPDVAEIQEAVTDELKKLQKEEFSAAFQKLYNHAKACIYTNGAYFELKKRYMFSSFLKQSVIKLLDCTVYMAIILTVDFSVSDLTQSTQTVVFENMILSRISGSNKMEITGRWRKLDIDKFYNLDFSPKLIGLSTQTE